MESVIPDGDRDAATGPKIEPSPTGRRSPEPRVYAREIPIDRIDPDAVKVLRRLLRHGHTAYLVGGGVRDLLLGRAPKDYDVATSARPNEVRDLFRNCRVIGRRFRLAHILFSAGKVVEVATFRQQPLDAMDVDETELAAAENLHDLDGPAPRRRDEGDQLIRHDNVFGEPHEDAFRRDFTINGLFYDIDRGEVIDYVGGMPDLERRTIRTIGDPDVRFREDPIRILRALKFGARLDFGIAPDVYDAMVAEREQLRKAAKPRVLEEMLRLLRGGAARRSIYLSWDVGALGVVMPELAAFFDDEAPGCAETWARLDAIDRRKQADELPNDAVLLAALWLGPLREAMDGAPDPGVAFEDFFDDIAGRLAVPRRMKDRMRLLVLSQRRLRANKISGLTHREFFADAATLYAMECEARGITPPSWATSPPESTEIESSPRPRRSRRRRRIA